MLHLSTKPLSVLVACPAGQRGSAHPPPSPPDAARASCIAAAGCRVAVHREVAFARARSYSMPRPCFCAASLLPARRSSVFTSAIALIPSFCHNKSCIIIWLHWLSPTPEKAPWFRGFAHWVSSWGCLMATYHLIFSSIPPILLILRFQHAFWPARLPLEPSL
jgi:hypothetical protein